MEIQLKAGKRYKICSCGLSQTLPFCDNAHRDFNATNNTEYKSSSASFWVPSTVFGLLPDRNLEYCPTATKFPNKKFASAAVA